MADVEATSTAYHSAEPAETSTGPVEASTTNTLCGSPHLFTAKRALIAILGIFLGFITLLPNAMMSDSSSISASIGMLASLSFGVGGLYGGYVGEFMWLLPAFGLQVLALLIFDTGTP